MNVMQSVLQRTLSFFKGTRPARQAAEPHPEVAQETACPEPVADPAPEVATTTTAPAAPILSWEQQVEEAIQKRVENAGPRDVIVVPAGFADKAGDQATTLELKSVRNAAKVTLGY